MSIEKGFSVGMQLMDARRLARIVHGDSLNAKAEPYRKILEGIAKQEGLTTLMALKRAIEIAGGRLKEGDELLFAAAAVAIIIEGTSAKDGELLRSEGAAGQERGDG